MVLHRMKTHNILILNISIFLCPSQVRIHKNRQSLLMYDDIYNIQHYIAEMSHFTVKNIDYLQTEKDNNNVHDI